MGRDEIVLSAGRSSERAHEKTYSLPEESYVMMGDYVELALLAARDCGFRRIHLTAQWAKLLKIAMGKGQTHVRFGVLEARNAVTFLGSLGIEIQGEFNTAREIFNELQKAGSPQPQAIFSVLCQAAKAYAERVTAGRPVIVRLVSYEGEVIARSE